MCTSKGDPPGIENRVVGSEGKKNTGSRWDDVENIAIARRRQFGEGKASQSYTQEEGGACEGGPVVWPMSIPFFSILKEGKLGRFAPNPSTSSGIEGSWVLGRDLNTTSI